ncbi:MAG: sigma-70 family RNA polymerase sigma factor [Planctomycetes bacterium]|nr:sigma-70 family RNA polymerase sigma factor [Planctomycetota bacterium]
MHEQLPEDEAPENADALPGDPEFGALLSAAKAGTRTALEALLEQLQPWLRREAELRMGEPMRAYVRPSDVTQEATVQVFSRLQDFGGSTEGQFHAWVRAIVENTARQLARYHEAQKRKAPSRTSQLNALAAELLPETPTPASELERAETISLLHRALGSLREDYRMIIEQTKLNGRPVVEVAEELGRSAASTRMLLSRACAALREAIEHLGHRGDEPVEPE